MSLRLQYRRLIALFLGHFREVRSLRAGASQMQERAQGLAAREMAAKRSVDEAEKRSARAARELEETKQALAVMTEARMNAERTVEVIRGELDALREVTEREIANMKQMVDWFGLEGRGRQVFGTAPAPLVREKDTEPAAPARMTGRAASRQLTEMFLREVEQRGNYQAPPPDAEYSSTSRAVAEEAGVTA